MAFSLQDWAVDLLVNDFQESHFLAGLRPQRWMRWGQQPEATGSSPHCVRNQRGGKDSSAFNCIKQLLTQTSEFLWKGRELWNITFKKARAGITDVCGWRYHFLPPMSLCEWSHLLIGRLLAYIFWWVGSAYMSPLWRGLPNLPTWLSLLVFITRFCFICCCHFHSLTFLLMYLCIMSSRMECNINMLQVGILRVGFTAAS